MKHRPWGVHAISDIYCRDVAAGLPDGRYVAAVCLPYAGNKIKAAWWVLTGRAFAFQWPEHGDLEKIFEPDAAKAPSSPSGSRED